MSSHPGFDDTALARLRSLGGEALVRRVVTLFLESAPQRLATARTAIQAGDLKGVERAAHTLKSSAGQLGALQVQELAGQVEHLAETGRTAEVPPLLEELAVALEQAAALLEVARQGHG